MIYTQADRAVMWLGNGLGYIKSHLANPLRRMRDFTDYVLTTTLPRKKKRSSGSGVARRAYKYLSLWQGFSSLSYWSRLGLSRNSYLPRILFFISARRLSILSTFRDSAPESINLWRKIVGKRWIGWLNSTIKHPLGSITKGLTCKALLLARKETHFSRSLS